MNSFLVKYVMKLFALLIFISLVEALLCCINCIYYIVNELHINTFAVKFSVGLKYNAFKMGGIICVHW